MSHIAQMNIARARYDFEDPRMTGFLALVEHVNAASDRAPGFVWRLDDGSGMMNAGSAPGEIVNLSVWRSLQDLRAFIGSGIHGHAMDRKSRWFVKLPEPYLVIWPVSDGHVPTLEEGYARLDLLRRNGPSPEAYGWQGGAVIV